MNEKSGVKGKLKYFVIIILSVLMMIAVVVLCAVKIERIQNEKNIIGTWTQSDSAEVLAFHDDGSLIMQQDMPEAGISSGSASYEFVYADTIRVTQGNNSVNFEIKANKNQLRLFFIGQEYLVLQKQ